MGIDVVEDDEAADVFDGVVVAALAAGTAVDEREFDGVLAGRNADERESEVHAELLALFHVDGGRLRHAEHVLAGRFEDEPQAQALCVDGGARGEHEFHFVVHVIFE